MNNQNNNKAPATVNLTTQIAADGFVELSIDVAGGYVFRDRLKADGFQFVRDRDSDAPTESRNRKPPAVWRRILVAVPPDVSEDRAIKGLEMAIVGLDGLLQGMLEGSRVKGAKSAAEALAGKYSNATGIREIAEKLSAMDTPWDNKVKRPPFAA